MPQAVDHVSRTVRDLAASDPQRAAMEFEGRVTTYADVNSQSDSLATLILEQLGEGVHQVAVRITDPHALIPTTVACRRAGKTVVFVDPTVPPARAQAMLLDSQSELLLTDADDDFGLPVLRPEDWSGRADEPVDLPLLGAAALIYTSGSTGGAKAITVNEAFLDQTTVLAMELGPETFGERMGILSTGSVGNAISFHRYLLAMGKTVLPFDVRTQGLTGMTSWLLEERVECVTLVPTLIRFLLPSLPEELVFPDLKVVFVYGEAMTGQDARALLRHLPSTSIIRNLYGSSEAGLLSHAFIGQIDDPADGPLPVGRPVSTVSIEILGPDRVTVLPPGEKGEIAARGVGMPYGYWRRPDLTEATFQPLPDGRMRVLTGDAGSLGEDGVLHHQGRLDDVIKVAANRIALGDVEEGLRSIPGVHEAVAAGRPDFLGNVRLIAFVTGDDLDPAALRRALSHRLPPPLLPDAIGLIDAIPMLPNGKLDRGALPELTVTTSTKELAPGLEAQIGELFCRVLELSSVGADDDFLALGGDSLRVAELFAAMADELGFDRPLSLILEASTPAHLAAALQHDEDGILVVARAEGSRPPLFVVHGALGNMVWLRDICRHIDEDVPVYGIRAPALDGLWPQEKSIAELATRYLQSVRRVQPNGPYNLFGFSLGGALVWEMTQQLTAAGEEVAFLGLGDSPADMSRAIPRPTVRSVARRLVKGKPVDAWQEQLAASRRGVPVPFARRGDFVGAVYVPLASKWRPLPWDGDVTIFQAMTGSVADPALWQELAATVSVVMVPGDHYGMVREGAEVLSKSLDQALRSA